MKEENFWLNLTIEEKDKIKQGIKELDNGKRILWQKVIEKLT
jgi:hypothetical protein